MMDDSRDLAMSLIITANVSIIRVAIVYFRMYAG